MALRKRRPGLVYPTLEDWHYVGSGGGEPAFAGTWTNVSGGTAMAFRIRELGVVDLAGVVNAGAGASGTIFTLPAGYRPSATTPGFAAYPGGHISVNASGAVISKATSGDVYVSGQFFLTPPAAAP